MKDVSVVLAHGAWAGRIQLGARHNGAPGGVRDSVRCAAPV